MRSPAEAGGGRYLWRAAIGLDLLFAAALVSASVIVTTFTADGGVPVSQTPQVTPAPALD